MKNKLPSLIISSVLGIGIAMGASGLSFSSSLLLTILGGFLIWLLIQTTLTSGLSATDFLIPHFHPFGMLEGIQYDLSQKEQLLALMLKNCIETGDLSAIYNSKYNHSTMVADDLLEEIGEKQYRLTKKSIGLLYGYYSK